MTSTQPASPSEPIPEVLRDRDQWLCWRTQPRDGTETKIPIDPATGQYASATDPETWGTYQSARTALETDIADGLGFVFTDADPFVGVDLDSCRDSDTGRPEAWAKTVISTLASYTEVSPSGTGYHVLLRGTLPGERNRRGGVEIYEDARFFTVTGDHVAGTPESIEARDGELEAVYTDHIAPDDEETNVDPESTSPAQPQPSTAVTLSDAALLERAQAAKNGAKFDRLWRGDTSGYDSHSEADMALCSLLAFWTGGDATRMNRLFTSSGLHRTKWDDVHFSDGSTYGEKTVERAISGTSEYYQPAGRQKSGTQGERAETDARRSQSESEPQPDSTNASEPPDESSGIGGDVTAGEASLIDLQERNAAHLETIAELEARLTELERQNERLARERQAARDRCDELEADQSSGRRQSRVWNVLRRVISRR
ncbi:phage NrS-1 polymerase family protein [Halostella salina]